MQRAALFISVLVATAAIGCDETDPSTPGGAGGGTGGLGGPSSATSGGAGGQSTTTGGPLPATFDVTGIVVDPFGVPIAGAIVMQAGGVPAVTTDADGTFTVAITQEIVGEPTVVAAKVGYRSAGESFFNTPIAPVTLVLYEIKAPDNALGYEFGEPGVGDPDLDNSTNYCGHCHTTLTAQFQTSKHAQATKSPLVQDLYAGTASGSTSAASCNERGGVWRDGTEPGAPGTVASRCYVGDGVLPDLNSCGASGGKACDDPTLAAAEKPTSFGGCADCHGFGMDGPAGGRDLLEATGVGFENGVHCDACHHVRDIDLAQPPGGAGRLVMQRPREKIGDEITGPIRQAMFGPYPDVPNPFMGGSYQPKFSEAEFCAGCHWQQQPALVPGASLDPTRWPDGLPTHDTYQEWLDGPFSATDTPCQSCHMPVESSLFNPVDVSNASNAGIAFGFERAEGTIRSHYFRGPLTKIPAVPRLLDGALGLSVTANVSGSTLGVNVTALNATCGHALPTGEPMRAIVLVVRVEGCSQVFEAIDGETIDEVGGAIARGSLGADALLVGTSLDWPGAAAVATPGQVIRIVSPTGAHVDYDGVGLFSGATLSPAQKGLEIRGPLGQATVLGVAGDTLTLSNALTAAAGDIVFLGQAAPPTFDDGAATLALAGHSGTTFSKVLVDPEGRERVPHHRAVDIRRDNRIRPGVQMTSGFGFAIPAGCSEAAVTVTGLYRPHPLELARERGWEALDYVATELTQSITLE